MTQHTSLNLRVENNTYSVTETSYDEDDKPSEGITTNFDTKEEAEDYMTSKTDGTKPTTTTTSKETTPIDNNTITEQELQEQNASGTDEQGREKPASRMTEADAVALNSDVHVAGQPERIVTQGQIDQVEAGLHPDATEGKPLIQENDKK